MNRSNKTSFLDAPLIVNPVSGKGDPKERRQVLKKFAKQHGWRGNYRETTPDISAKQIAEEEVREGAKHLIIAGGDGSIMEVLEVAMKHNVSLGIIPLGTANLLARNLSIPLNTDGAVEIAFAGKKTKIDVGSANQKLFSVIAGIGLDAQIMKAAERKLKNKWGILAYFVSFIQNLNIKSSKFEIKIDDKKPFTTKAKTILAANTGKFLGGIEIVPGAKVQNGTLQLGIVKASSIVSWLNLLTLGLIGQIAKSSHYDAYQAQQIQIKVLGKKQRFQCDGDIFPPTDHLSIKIHPKTVTIMVSP